MNPIILVPVKDAAKAKSRMSPLLNADERAAVACALLEDLIRALRPLPFPVAVATDLARAAALVRTLRWEAFHEEDQISESSSVDAASKRLAGNGFDAVLRLPADLPLVRTEDIAELLSQPLPSPPRLPSWRPPVPGWAPMRSCAPPLDVFPSRFGHDSFAGHIREAAAAGAQLRIVENPRIALDLDDPADIAHFLAQPAAGETYRVLLKLRVKERLLHYAG